ncbi:MAG: hypothetical protein ACP5FZ_06380 [Fidelibacterota bacterium]
MENNKNTKKIKNITDRKGFSNSNENFQKIMKEIAPFVKKKHVNIHSTAGKWSCSSSLYTK